MLSIQRSKFSLPKGTTYLNCAYMSPLLKSVEKAGIKGIYGKRNPAAISQDDFFLETEAVRVAYAQVIGVSDPKRIALIGSVSYGMATVANNLTLKSSDNIIVAADQFPSNYYSWQKLCRQTGAKLKVIAPPASLLHRGRQWNEFILNAIDKNTRLVALGHVHWADGTLFNLQEIRKRTSDVGALLVIDGTQSVGALPFDVRSLKPDALICAGYKWLMGPYSLGLAYYGDYFDNGKPLEENWINRLHSEDFSQLVIYEEQYQPGALRYEVGEHSNFILVPMLHEAIQQINHWKPENIQAYCHKITQKPLAQLRSAGFWVEDDDYRGKHLFGIRIPSEMNMDLVKAKISKAKISVSIRGNAIRVAPHVYNSEADIQKLVNTLLSV